MERIGPSWRILLNPWLSPPVVLHAVACLRAIVKSDLERLESPTLHASALPGATCAVLQGGNAVSCVAWLIFHNDCLSKLTAQWFVVNCFTSLDVVQRPRSQRQVGIRELCGPGRCGKQDFRTELGLTWTHSRAHPAPLVCHRAHSLGIADVDDGAAASGDSATVVKVWHPPPAPAMHTACSASMPPGQQVRGSGRLCSENFGVCCSPFCVKHLLIHGRAPHTCIGTARLPSRRLPAAVC